LKSADKHPEVEISYEKLGSTRNAKAHEETQDNISQFFARSGKCADLHVDFAF
jgi:hypothetical protein